MHSALPATSCHLSLGASALIIGSLLSAPAPPSCCQSMPEKFRPKKTRNNDGNKISEAAESVSQNAV
jgi:hypothetical protein